ncbi:GDYXXLXY domain-containing protein [Psychrobacter sp. 16-MNA-CIBAN-0192]|uniref:GDYXXLXY domain-containing protein n=1 Tax=Psychrobacter sp. 16-MNA-CIBAN-0192 TaxID=3140448 RepID=UPI0033291C90
MKHSTMHTLPWWRQRAIIITIAILGLLAVLITVNANIIKYENHLMKGATVLLELAPVDPRGFMQGDYMALSYALERDIIAAIEPENLEPSSNLEANLEANPNSDANDFESEQTITQPKDGYVIVKVDAHKVGHFVRLADSNSRAGLATNELPIYYRIRDNRVRLATNAFFFQEGHAKSFETAKYGLFRINDKGAPLLTEMVNENFQMIKGKADPTDTLNP